MPLDWRPATAQELATAYRPVQTRRLQRQILVNRSDASGWDPSLPGWRLFSACPWCKAPMRWLRQPHTAVLIHGEEELLCVAPFMMNHCERPGPVLTVLRSRHPKPERLVPRRALSE